AVPGGLYSRDREVQIEIVLRVDPARDVEHREHRRTDDAARRWRRSRQRNAGHCRRVGALPIYPRRQLQTAVGELQLFDAQPAHSTTKRKPDTVRGYKPDEALRERKLDLTLGVRPADLVHLV